MNINQLVFHGYQFGVDDPKLEQKISELLQLIVATREYQMA